MSRLSLGVYPAVCHRGDVDRGLTALLWLPRRSCAPARPTGAPYWRLPPVNEAATLSAPSRVLDSTGRADTGRDRPPGQPAVAALASPSRGEAGLYMTRVVAEVGRRLADDLATRRRVEWYVLNAGMSAGATGLLGCSLGSRGVSA